MPRHTTAADATPLRVVIVTLDSHIAGTVERATRTLHRELPGLSVTLHAAAEWGSNPHALDLCRADIAQADFVVATMLFLDEHIRAIRPALEARRDKCDAMVCCVSAAEITNLTRLGRFTMNGTPGGPLGLLKRLRGSRASGTTTAGAQQMRMLRRLPHILRFIPGKAQDVRAWFLTMQYWLAGSEDNVCGLVRMLVDRYADGPRRGLRGRLKVTDPVVYPDVGVYHPRMRGRMAEDAAGLPAVGARGTVGLLVLRSYLLANNTGHYDGVIDALEARGLRVIPAFASGLDARPAIEQFFLRNGKPQVDAIVSLTGFSLVGGPAYNDARAAEEILARMDVPYMAAHPVEFQTLEQWESSDRGLYPVESTIMVAIPELDGATSPMVFGGRSESTDSVATHDMKSHPGRAAALAARVARMVALRATPVGERKLAIVLFNFPPNAGATGTAAHLSVFASLLNVLRSLQRAGYDVEAPANEEALRERILVGNAGRYGTDANVHARIPTDDHVRRERWLREIETHWGPAPGRQQTDGSSLFVLGARFGNVFVGIQPAFGYEGDPMRLLFEKGFAPTHAFSAFYRYLKEDFQANAVLHFGTHGALEFMPGKQCGMSDACWPERLIGELPNFYLYASNNPSEGSIAKRRSGATLISYMTPPVTHAGLYRGLSDLKESVERWRSTEPSAHDERAELAHLIQTQAAALELDVPEPAWDGDLEHHVARVGAALHELEQTLIPFGMHVVGQPMAADHRVDMLGAVLAASHGIEPDVDRVRALVEGASPMEAAAAADGTVDPKLLAAFESLAQTDRLLAADHETPSLLHALEGGFVRPAPGGDVLRTPAVLPTGRNLHGFDPFRIPSAFAVQEGARQAARILERHIDDGHPLPESIAIVLWGTDNLKSEGAPIGQALALVGARPRFDSYGRLAGATLIPLEELGRPRIDVMVSLSGIFRDLLPLQTRLLAEAAWLAATADEPEERNYVRKHALAHCRTHGCDMETAALRVFGNADGAYGSNVNHLVESGAWSDEDELAETYTRRKGFAYGRNGSPIAQPELLQSVLSKVELSYQNLESVEVGVTTVDHYFDSLGGVTRAIRRARKGEAPTVYIGDSTQGDGKVRTLAEQVALETRTRMLNPKWYEGMLEHGYEGVRQIEAHVTNTVGWSATTGSVAPWVYQQLTETFMLDPEMRERLARLNPTASARVANRLLEAHERNYWTPDDDVLDALRRAGEDLEDRLEGLQAA